MVAACLVLAIASVVAFISISRIATTKVSQGVIIMPTIAPDDAPTKPDIRHVCLPPQHDVESPGTAYKGVVRESSQ